MSKVLAVMLVVVAAACRKQQQPPPAPPVTAAMQELRASSDAAERQWLVEGACRGNLAGTWEAGTWVQTRRSDVCTRVRVFAANGELHADVACCEGVCRPDLPQLGPATSDLCRQAQAELQRGPLWLSTHDDATVTRTSGEVVPPAGQRRWGVAAGSYRVTTRRHTVELEVSADGRSVAAVGQVRLGNEGRGLCTLGTASEPDVVMLYPCAAPPDGGVR